jgi:uncharacterized membrane protein
MTTPPTARLDWVVEGCVCFIMAIALCSMGLASAVHFASVFGYAGLEQDRETLKKLELGMLAVFGLAWLLATCQQVRAVSRHKAQARLETGADWLPEMYASFLKTWEGCCFEADVGPDGEVGLRRPVPGMVPPPTAGDSLISNPLATSE